MSWNYMTSQDLSSQVLVELCRPQPATATEAVVQTLVQGCKADNFDGHCRSKHRILWLSTRQSLLIKVGWVYRSDLVSMHHKMTLR